MWSVSRIAPTVGGIFAVIGLVAMPSFADAATVDKRWVLVADGVSNQARPSFTQDSVDSPVNRCSYDPGVAVLWTQASPSGQSIMSRTIGECSNRLLAPQIRLSGWQRLSQDPITKRNLNWDLIAAGVEPSPGASGQSWPGAGFLNLFSDDRRIRLTASDQAVDSHGQAAAINPGFAGNDEVIYVFTQGQSVKLQRRVPTAELPGTDAIVNPGNGARVYRPAVAAAASISSDVGWVAWYADGPRPGIMARKFKMGSSGTTFDKGLTAPGSALANGRVPNQRLALANTSRPLPEFPYATVGRTWLSYPTETNKGHQVRVWNFGTSKHIDIPTRKRPRHVSSAVGFDGRLWLGWVQGRRAVIAQANKSITKVTIKHRVEMPNGPIRSLNVAATRPSQRAITQVHLATNAGGSIYLHRFQ